MMEQSLGCVSCMRLNEESNLCMCLVRVYIIMFNAMRAGAHRFAAAASTETIVGTTVDCVLCAQTPKKLCADAYSLTQHNTRTQHNTQKPKRKRNGRVTCALVASTHASLFHTMYAACVCVLCVLCASSLSHLYSIVLGFFIQCQPTDYCIV